MKRPVVLTLTRENFPTQVLRSAAPVLVCFWAEWCGPCKTIGPVLDELADEYGDRVKIGRVDVDDQPALASEFGVRAVPTLLLLRGGRVASRFVGPSSKRELEESFDRVAA